MYMNQLTFLTQIGESAVMMLEAANKDAEPDETLNELNDFISNFADIDDTHTSEFDAWICDLLEMCDNLDEPISHPEQGSYYSLQELSSALTEMSVNNTQDVLSHFLVDPGAPKNLWCTTN